jgi:hypothetical protein
MPLSAGSDQVFKVLAMITLRGRAPRPRNSDRTDIPADRPLLPTHGDVRHPKPLTTPARGTRPVSLHVFRP